MNHEQQELAMQMQGMEENGDSFEQQIEQHIQNLQRPLDSERAINGDGGHHHHDGAHHQQGQAGREQVTGMDGSFGRAQQEGAGRVQQRTAQAHVVQRKEVTQQVIRVSPQQQIIVSQPVSSREPSPNRFYSQGPAVTISRQITPPKPRISFGPEYIHTQPIPYNPNLQPSNNPSQTIIRSRVISQIQRPPTQYIPNNIQIKPQSTTVIRSQERIGGQPVYRAPTGSRIYERPGVIVGQVRNFSPPAIHHTEIPKITINNHSATLVHHPIQQLHQAPHTQTLIQQHQNAHFMHQQPQPQLQPQPHPQLPPQLQPQLPPQPHPQQTLQRIPTITLNQTANIHITIKQFTVQMQTINQMITIMMKGEKEKDKLEFINKLMREYRVLEGKLEVLNREIAVLSAENGELKRLLDNPQATSINHQVNYQKINDQPESGQQTTRTHIQQLQLLQQKIHSLQSQNQTLLQKYTSLQQKQIVQQHLSHEELLETIESQKSMIRRLEQELIATNNKPVSKESRDVGRDGADGGESKFMAIIDSKEAYINQLEAEIIRHKTNIKSLKQQVVKERNERNLALTASQEMQRLEHQRIIQQQQQRSNPNVLSNQNSMSSGQGTPTIPGKQKNVEKLQNLLKQKDEELDKLKEKIFEVQDEFDQMVDERDRKIKDLHEQIMALSEKSNTERKQEEDLESELKKIRTEIAGKDEQLSKLKTSIQRTSQLQQKIQQLQSQKHTLNQSLQLKISSQQKLQQTLTSLQTRLKSQNSSEQTKIIIEALKKKQNQAIKLRQIIDLHVTNIQELEGEVNGLKEGFRNFQAELDEERRTSTQKYADYENKIREIESRGNSQHKSEQSEIEKLHHTISQLKQKLKSYEDPHHHHHQHNPSHQHLQASSATTNQQDHPHDFRLQYSESQVKIFQLQNTIKDRENRIKQLQNTLQTMRLKINHNNLTEQDMISNQEIELLRKKIEELEARGGKNAGGNMGYGYLNRDYQTNSLFQHRVIYELKAENEKLRAMLSRQDWQDAHSYKIKPNSRISMSPKKLDKQEYSYISNIQYRLTEFNKKLSELINQSQNPEQSHYHRHSPHKKSPYKQAPTQQLLQMLQKQKNQLIYTHQKEIQTLQARIVDLQRYCSSLQFHEGIATFDYTQISHTEKNVKDIGHEQNLYYREKNKELEGRVDVLLELNKELKDKLAIYMKPQGESNIDFYKKQVEKLQKRILQLEGTIKAQNQEKATLVLQLQKIQSDKSCQSLIQTLQHSLQDQTSKLAKLQSQNNLLQQQMKRYTQQVIDLSSEVLKYKGLLHEAEERSSQMENKTRKQGSRVQDLEDEVTRANNQCQLLKAEIQRLEEELSRKKGDSEKEILNLRAKLAELQQQFRQMNSKLSSLSQQNNQKDHTIAILNGKLSVSDKNYANQTAKIYALSQRIRELENQLHENQMALARLTNQKNQLVLALEQRNSELATLNRRLIQITQQKDSNSASSSKYQSRISQLQDTLRKIRQQLQLQKKSKQKYQQQNQTLTTTAILQTKTIAQLQQKMTALEARGQQLGGIQYELELIRSIFIEIEALSSEIMVKEDARQKGVMGRVREEVMRGLERCGEIWGIVEII